MFRQLVVASWMVSALLAVGCESSGPQSSEALINAYRAAQASGDRQQVCRLIAWVEDVRPALVDPYAGGPSARRLTRSAIEWGLTGDPPGPITIEQVEPPEEYRNATIAPQPLYWLRIVRHPASDVDVADDSPEAHDGAIELPVIPWQGTHRFYGSPYYALETSFGPAATAAQPKRTEEVEIPWYDQVELQLAALADNSPIRVP